MGVVIVTGSNGLIGSETVRFFSNQGFEVVGIDNNMREFFFGEEAGTSNVGSALSEKYPSFKLHEIDIRDDTEIQSLFKRFRSNVELIVHTAAQPSHDWAVKNPRIDFEVNTLGTFNLLEAMRVYCPNSVFVYMSTNKVYGDSPNRFLYDELELRYAPNHKHHFSTNGFDESLSIDQSLHSIFGANKLAADILTQEYGKYFGLRTTCLRGGCLSGPSHQGAELHGFLSYLVKCAILNRTYSIFGYKGKQVRDNLHSVDVVSAIWQVFRAPKIGEVFNLGGGLESNISILEAIEYLKLKGRELNFEKNSSNRLGDHQWWISDTRKFKEAYPAWKVTRNCEDIIDETIESLI